MTDTDSEVAGHPDHHNVRDRLHDRIVAAEIAAEEAAEFGPGTAFVEAVEAAANPERVDRDEAVTEAKPAPEKPGGPSSAH